MAARPPYRRALILAAAFVPLMSKMLNFLSSAYVPTLAASWMNQQMMLHRRASNHRQRWRQAYDLI